ncbi:hypothetical protein GJ744_006751 [Endocarpon pusillum]|uniref:SMP domain-containing protein n=1 Tax=Endocarpon pusillum TaxID=364733 RepID=A0A8H7A6S8_9EURO|nr:hypothetical protein GJ744_006751 [Endocarpon pusillum]
MASKVDSNLMSKMTAEEKKITGQDHPVKGGPTAQAQKHANQPLNSEVIHDITKGEEKITGDPNPMQSGPTSTAQSILTKSGNAQTTSNAPGNQQENHSGILDSSTISKITDAEKKITGDDQPARGGPTARAQQHSGEPITSKALHDITEGEKKVTGGERVKGGPTSTAQSELAKSRS